MGTANMTPTPTARLPISRFNLILTVVLVVQLALVGFVYRPRPTTGGDGSPLLGDLTTDAVTAMTITDNTDRSVTLERSEDGWTLAGTGGYPAKATSITDLLDKLVTIKSDRLVATTAASQGRLQVGDDDFLRKLDLTTADGVKTLYLGSSGGASATHVRAAGDNNTYLTGAVASWDLNPVASSWIDVAYFNVATSDILTATLENANGTLTFIHNDDWTLADLGADEQASSANISTLMGRLSAINLHTVLGKTEQPEYGLATPQATVTLQAKTADGGEQTTTFVLGAKDTDTNTYYFKSSASPYYVLLAAYTGDEFATKQRSDYLAQPEAEAATDGAALPTPAPAAVPTAASPVPTLEPTP